MKMIRFASVGMAGVLAGSAVFAATSSDKDERQQWHQKMEAQMKEQDAELDKLEQQINSASGEQQKVDALAAAVTKLIEQRKAMHAQLQAVHERAKERRAERRQGTAAPSPAEQAPSGGTTGQPTQQ